MVNHDFWAKLTPKLQETIVKLWTDNLPIYRENSAKAQQNGREALEKTGVAFVDVGTAELDAVRAKMLPEQDKTAADAHMSPELIKLVMADASA
jgi:TRAP-type C4-dicarboxylate transport system substrate-binding protein